MGRPIEFNNSVTERANTAPSQDIFEPESTDQTKMTEKQKKFCDFYILSGNATQSAIQAGYSEDTAKTIGCQNLTKLYLIDYIKERTQKASNSRIADIIERKELLTSFLRGQEEGDSKDRLKAVEMLGKMEGDFIERVETSGTQTRIHKIERVIVDPKN
jgi:phage terminase small subunit